MPKVLLIQSAQYNPDGIALLKHKHMYLSGLALPLLAAYVPSNWDVHIINEIIEDVDLNEECDLVGIGVMGYSIQRAIKLAEEFKRRKRLVFFGGIISSYLPSAILSKVDSVVIGAGDISFPKLLKDFEETGTIKSKYDNPLFDLKDIPVPRYDLLPKGKVRYMLPVQSSRGCPNVCSFCSTSNLYKGKYLVRPIEDVICDIRKVKELGYKRFFMLDDNVNGNFKHLKELAIAIKKENISWSAQCTINIAKNDELIKLLVDSRCKMLSIGLESINQQVVDTMKKKWIHTSETSMLVKKLKKKGFRVLTSFLIGTDFDTEDSLKATVKFINRNKLEIPVLNILTPIPGTAIYEQIKSENRLLTNDLSRYTGFNTVHEPKLISSARLNSLFWEMYDDLYSIKNIIYRNLLSVNVFKYPVSTFFAFYINLHYRKSIKKRVGPLNI